MKEKKNQTNKKPQNYSMKGGSPCGGAFLSEMTGQPTSLHLSLVASKYVCELARQGQGHSHLGTTEQETAPPALPNERHPQVLVAHALHQHSKFLNSVKAICGEPSTLVAQRSLRVALTLGLNRSSRAY